MGLPGSGRRCSSRKEIWKQGCPCSGGSPWSGEGCLRGGWGAIFAGISESIEMCALNNKGAIRAVSLHARAGITHVMSRSSCLENSNNHCDKLKNKLGNVQFSRTYQCYNHFSQEKLHHIYLRTFAQSPNMFGHLHI